MAADATYGIGEAADADADIGKAADAQADADAHARWILQSIISCNLNTQA